jgi:predicted RNA-binding protein with PIN domain
MRRLVNELAQHKWRAGGEWTIVFDGQPRQGLADAPAGVQVEYALRGGANGADDRIVEIVDQTTRSSKVPEVLVYTSDRALRERLLPLGARVEGASALLRALRELP